MSPRSLLVSSCVLLLLSLAAPAGAQTEGEMTMDLGLPSTNLAPGGDPVVIPVTLTYKCETLWASGATITLAASSTDVEATFTFDPTAITPTMLPDCSAGDDVTGMSNLTVAVTEDVMFTTDEGTTRPLLATDAVEVLVNASSTHAVGGAFGVEKTISLNVAPVVDVSYDAGTTTLTAVQGELVTLSVNATSMSNDAVTITATVPDWNLTETAPDIPELGLEAFTEGSNSTWPLTFTFQVPADAEVGTHMFTLHVEAAAEGDASVTETEDIPYDLTVEKRKRAGGSNDSPAPALVAVVGVIVAVAAAARRRVDR